MLFVGSVVGPDEVEDGAGAVFPAEQGRAAKGLEVEVRVVDGEGFGRACTVGIDEIITVIVLDGRAVLPVFVEIVRARPGKLFESGVPAHGEEGLHVELEGELGRERPVDARRHGQGGLLHGGEDVPIAVGLDCRLILLAGHPLHRWKILAVPRAEVDLHPAVGFDLDAGVDRPFP